MPLFCEGRAGRLRGGVLFKLVVFLVVVFAFVALGWMLFLPVVLATQLRARTGFDATIGQLSVNPLAGTIALKGLIVTNPPTFPVRDFVELREFHANLRVFSLFTDRLVFDSMWIDVANVTLVTRSDGITNAVAFARNWREFRSVPAMPIQSRAWLIRELHLQLNRLVIADYTRRQPTTRDFDLQIDQTYEEVTRLPQLLQPAVLKGLAPVALAVGALLPGDAGSLLQEAGRTARQPERRSNGEVRGFFDALEESKKP